MKEGKGWEELQTSGEGRSVVWSYDWGELEKIDFMKVVVHATKITGESM